jgi:antitoxin (DNA-binding transcriptional repressor) of toxin-antitoxin stability system
MRTVSMSVTEASRNFADCINRARYQGTTFILHKNGVAVARIVPERKALTEKELQAEASDLAFSEEGDQPPKEDSNGSHAGKLRTIW